MEEMGRSAQNVNQTFQKLLKVIEALIFAKKAKTSF